MRRRSCGSSPSTPVSPSTRCVEATGFELGSAGRSATCPPPASRPPSELALIDRARPEGPALPRGGGMSDAASGARGAHDPLHRADRRPLPDRADRHGLGLRCPADGGDGHGRRPRDHRVQHDERPGAGDGDPGGQGEHRRAVRRQHPLRRPRRRRARRSDDPRGRQGGVVRAGPEEGTDRRSSRTPASSPCRPSGARRHAEKVAALGRRRGHRAGRRGRRPHRVACPPPCCCRRSSMRSTSRSSPPAASSTAAA